LQNGYSPPIEGDKLFCSEPVPFVGAGAVRKISTGTEYLQTSLYGWPVDYDMGALYQFMHCVRYLRSRLLVSSTEYPDKFTQNRNRRGN
jgi:hypothetical protein